MPGSSGKSSSVAEPDAPLPVVSVEDGAVSEQQAQILRLLDAREPVQIDDLIADSGLSTPQVLAELTMLQIGGYVREHDGKRYTRTVELRDDL